MELGILLVRLTLQSLCKGNLLLLRPNLPLGVTNEEVLSTPSKRISGVVAGDSSLPDSGVARYLLSLLFSFASLLSSFYLCLCVLYQKHPKN